MFVHFPNKVFRPYSCLGSRNLCGDNSRRTICFWQKKLITNVERKCRFSSLKPRPNDSLYRRSITETEKTHLFGKTVMSVGEKDSKFSNGALPRTPPGASPLGTPTGRCPAPRQGLRPLEPRFNYSYSIIHWLDERALRTSLTRFRT